MDNNYIKMADGTVKQINPFTGTEVWSVPGRASKPITNIVPATAKPLTQKPVADEDYCNFCAKKYGNTPPEKARMVRDGNGFSILKGVPAPDIHKTTAEFRRIPNLFEIVSYDYWQKNFGYRPPEEIVRRKEAYLATPEGKSHVENVLKIKLKAAGKSDADIAAYSEEEKSKMTDAFFAGGHELIVAARHFAEGATHDSQLCSSGEMTPDQHFRYFQFTIEA